MQYNKQTIKQFKSKTIELTYKPKKSTSNNKLTGDITANTSDHILFRVNKNKPELALNYSQIIDIKEPEIDKYKSDYL